MEESSGHLLLKTQLLMKSELVAQSFVQLGLKTSNEVTGQPLQVTCATALLSTEGKVLGFFCFPLTSSLSLSYFCICLFSLVPHTMRCCEELGFVFSINSSHIGAGCYWFMSPKAIACLGLNRHISYGRTNKC